MSDMYPATGTDGLGLDETELPGVAAPSAQPDAPGTPAKAEKAATATRERSSTTVSPQAPGRNGAPARENQPGTNQSVSTWNKEAVIELQGLSKAFGSFKVLDGVTCRIPKGEITVLMGPSGTGKSVTLRHVVGLLNPDAGDIIVEGKHVPKLNEKDLLALRRSIGMLFQDGALFSSMNLYDNVAFPLRQHTKLPETKVREIVMQRLQEVGLAGAEKRMPNELSGGMRKRAGFARALVMEPKILLFDEPDSGLDPVRTTLLCDLIREISAKYKATSVVVSHDVGAVRRFADNIGILYKGKMRHFGTKEEIENSPDEFVKQFFNAASEGPLGMD
jgi:phospholipid/cholesterol/gamma-HCH transport system ATP-binding protein